MLQDEASIPPRNPHLRADRPPHEQLLTGLTDQDYQQWRHHPLTAAYLLYLGDQIDAFRTAAADLLESGALSPQGEVIRGRILTLRDLQNLSLDAIQNFYRQETQAGDAATSD